MLSEYRSLVSFSYRIKSTLILFRSFVYFLSYLIFALANASLVLLLVVWMSFEGTESKFTSSISSGESY